MGFTISLRKVSDYTFAPYELVVDGNNYHFYLCRFNIIKNPQANPLEHKTKVILTNFEIQKYSKPTSYSSAKYLITTNFIASINNAEVLPSLTLTPFQTRYNFLLVWEKQPFDSDKPSALNELKTSTIPEDKLKYQELSLKNQKEGTGFTYRIERLPDDDKIMSRGLILEAGSDES